MLQAVGNNAIALDCYPVSAVSITYCFWIVAQDEHLLNDNGMYLQHSKWDSKSTELQAWSLSEKSEKNVSFKVLKCIVQRLKNHLVEDLKKLKKHYQPVNRCNRCNRSSFYTHLNFSYKDTRCQYQYSTWISACQHSSGLWVYHIH